MKKAMIGYQMYSAREEAAADLKGVLKKLAAMGYDGVEFAGLFDNSPEKVKAICDENGLVPISAHVSYDEIAADPEKVISDYAKIGCKYIAIPYAVEERRPGGELFDETVEGIRNFAAIGKKYGITMLYHNHDFEFEKLNGEYLLDLLYKALSADELQTELDTCWVNYGGEDPAAYLRKYAGRAPVVHIKDFVAKSRGAKVYDLIGIDDGAQELADGEKDFSYMPVGYGVQDMPAIVEACKDAGSEWLIIEQDDPSMGKTPLECIKLSIDYLKTINK